MYLDDPCKSLSDIVFCYLVCNIHYSVGRVSCVRLTLTEIFKYATYFVMGTYIMIHLSAMIFPSSMLRTHLGGMVLQSRLWYRRGPYRLLLW